MPEPVPSSTASALPHDDLDDGDRALIAQHLRMTVEERLTSLVNTVEFIQEALRARSAASDRR